MYLALNEIYRYENCYKITGTLNESITLSLCTDENLLKLSKGIICLYSFLEYVNKRANLNTVVISSFHANV